MWPGHSSNSSTIINYFFAIIYLTTYSFVDCNHKFSAVSKVKASEQKHTLPLHLPAGQRRIMLAHCKHSPFGGGGGMTWQYTKIHTLLL